ncbi:glycoside hydrolase family 92 protein [Fistulina hepatica ATCC 64428]|uniref:Glycoside hydrolase family 92 protein n=1 Tax=Fistulina hepatica ATCC 64428 TaxID=1128425 RepID=A0A0D7ANQ4_9AGAR|nr:glycoside hydrolase family 92 protein [Fistulina hepatica ATCC 64428]
MVKVGMDTDSPYRQSGYDANSTYNATGFSQLHDDGTGGAYSLSNFKVWPVTNCTEFRYCATAIDDRKLLRNILYDGRPDDYASPGYFSSNLSNGVRVELTSTSHAALHRYTFPSDSTAIRILLDLTNDGQQSSTDPVLALDPDTGRISGGAQFASSFGQGRYRTFVCADFRGDGYDLGSPTEYGMYIDDNPTEGTANVTQLFFDFDNELGALLSWGPPADNEPVILVRVGVSFISAEQACSNGVDEIPDFDFDSVHAASRSQWNDILTRFQVDTTNVSNEIVQLFYSSIYRTHITPADYTGENPLWVSSEPYYDSFYCNWDTYRTLYSLMSLHDPVSFSRIVRGMINIQEHEGWLPECRGATTMQFVQGGSNGDPILGEFFVKRAAELNVSSEALYGALLADAEVQPPNWNLHGRQADVWKKLNYVAQDMFSPGGANTRQVSRTLEYAFDDFSIGQVAKILNLTDDYEKYMRRAGNFFNVWNPNVTIPGAPEIAPGMMQPRFANGTFNYTDPRHCSVHDPEHATCYLNAIDRDGFYESSPIVYVPHDTAKLVDMQGGREAFIKRLDFIFNEDYFDVTDEPSMEIPYMYHYANRPGLSTQRSRQVIAQSFNTTVNGLPGNDGAMASWAAFFLLGLYPITATRQYLLSSPFFPEVSIYNPVFNSTTTVKVLNFVGNPHDGTGGTVFVQNVTVNGTPYKSNCYLDWDVFVNGSVVELTLSDDIELTCGEGADALPPSLSTGGY